MKGRFLAPPSTLVFVLVGDPPDAGYAIRPVTGDLYRNGEHQGKALSLKYDDRVGGVWIEYDALPGTQLGRLGAVTS